MGRTGAASGEEPGRPQETVRGGGRATSSEAGRTSQLLADLLLLAFAMAILVVPRWLGDRRDGAPRLRSVDVEPVTIEVNSAPWYQWTLLDGIGEARARRIVEHRRRRGGFRSIDDLRSVPGMPRGWVDEARACLRLQGR